MTTDFYADPGVGGDGSHTTDDDNASTGLANGGFWTRLLPMFKNIVAVANFAKSQAAAAQQYAAAAASSASTTATTGDTLNIGLYSNVTVAATTGKLFIPGQQIMVARTADPTMWMSGTVKSYNSSTGSLQFNTTNVSGSGTYAGWTISLSGPAAGTGVVNEQRSTDVASATTVDLNSVTGNFVYLTGTATITSFILPKGAERVCYAASSGLTLKYTANVINTPTYADIVCAAGDFFTVRAFDVNVVGITSYTRANGRALAETVTKQPGLVCINAVDITSTVASVGFSLDGSYDDLTLEVVSVVPGTAGYPLTLSFSTDGGATFYQSMSSVGGSPWSTATSTSGVAAVQLHTVGVDTVNGMNATVDMYNFPSTIRGKSIHVKADNFGAFQLSLHTTGNMSTPINFIKLACAGSLAGGSVRLYGRRKAVS